MSVGQITMSVPMTSATRLRPYLRERFATGTYEMRPPAMVTMLMIAYEPPCMEKKSEA